MTRRPARGFTLLEILVAVALMAVIGALAATLLQSTLRNGSALESRHQALRELQTTLTLIRRDLEQLVDRPSRNEYRGEALRFEGYPRTAADREGLLLAFIHDGRRALNPARPGSSLERVRYRLSGGELIRESSPVLDPATATDWSRRTLLSQAEAVRLRFYREDDWQRQALRLGPQDGPLPRAVAVEVSTQPWPAVEAIILTPEAIPPAEAPR